MKLQEKYGFETREMRARYRKNTAGSQGELQLDVAATNEPLSS